MSRKSPQRIVLVLAAVLIALSMFAAPGAAARSKTLHFRVVKHARAYDVVKGHAHRFRLRHHVRAVTFNRVGTFSVVARNARYVVLRTVVPRVTSPNEGVFAEGSTTAVTWKMSTAVSTGYFRVELTSTTDGITKPVSGSKIPVTRRKMNFSAPWNVSQGAGSYKVCVYYCSSDGRVLSSDTSDGVVTIAAAPMPEPTPTASPVPTPTLTPSPTPTASPTDSITVSGTSSAAVDTAISAATPGDTVFFPAGVYSHSGRLIIPDQVSLRGAGIYRPPDGSGTWLQFAIKWGSHQTVEGMRIGGAGSTFYPLTRETTNSLEQTRCPDTSANGSHEVIFQSVRFRGASNLVNLGGYSGDWTSPVNKTDSYHTAWYDCEFERGNDMTNTVLNSAAHAGEGNIFNIWVDGRNGGSRIYDLKWVRCHFGVKNGVESSSTDGREPGTSAQADGYGCNRLAILMQPAPAEYGLYGPRKNLSSFDWSRVDHAFPGPYLVKDCVFEYSWEYTINPCDMSRAYSMSQCARAGHCDDQGGNWTHPGGGGGNCPSGWGNPTGARWTDLPDHLWLEGMTISGNLFKGNVPGGSMSSTSVIVGEQMKNTVSSYNSSGSGALSSPHDGRFGNVNVGNVWGTGVTAYTPSPYDP